MRKYKKVKTVETRISKVFCDRCKSPITIGTDSVYNEGIRLYYEFGYFSPRDGAVLDMDICSDCLIKLFEDFIE